MAGAEKTGEGGYSRKWRVLPSCTSQGLRGQGRPVPSSPLGCSENKIHIGVTKAGEVKKAPESRDLSYCRAFLWDWGKSADHSGLLLCKTRPLV